MKFDIKKVKTCATAHEVKDGTNGWGADSIFDLKIYVEGNEDSLLFVIDEKRGAGNIAFPFNSLYRYFYPYEKATYEERQADCGLKVGDRVRVTRRAGHHEEGWANSWTPHMNSMVGQISTIESLDEGIGIKLKSGNYFPYFVLEKVQEPTYRPFANVGEFLPHKDKWVTLGRINFRIIAHDKYSISIGNSGGFASFKKAFETTTFEDGTPFGMEVEK